MDELKNELAGLMKEVPASSIPLEKPSTKLVRVDVNINSLNREIWGSKSNQLLDDYKYGEALAKYGESSASAKTFMKRFAESFIAIISNEYQKRGNGSEELKAHFKILESTFQLIAKEIEKKDLKDFNASSIIASLQGFLANYNQTKELK